MAFAKKIMSDKQFHLLHVTLSWCAVALFLIAGACSSALNFSYEAECKFLCITFAVVLAFMNFCRIMMFNSRKQEKEDSDKDFSW